MRLVGPMASVRDSTARVGTRESWRPGASTSRVSRPSVSGSLSAAPVNPRAMPNESLATSAPASTTAFIAPSTPFVRGDRSRPTEGSGVSSS